MRLTIFVWLGVVAAYADKHEAEKHEVEPTQQLKSAEVAGLNAESQALDQVLKTWFDSSYAQRRERVQAYREMGPSVPTHGLSEAEMIALYGYTQADYDLLNKVLRGVQTPPPTRADLEPYIKVLNSALSKLAPVTKTVYRWSDLPPEVLKKYVVGQTVTLEGFTSTTLNSNSEYQEAGHGFVIQSCSGRLIQDFATYPSEQEVLFVPGVKMLVTGKVKSGEKVKYIDGKETIVDLFQFTLKEICTSKGH